MRTCNCSISWHCWIPDALSYSMDCKSSSLQSVIENYEVFQVFWDEARDITSDSENRARITGVKAQMEKFEFLFGLCLGECILRHTDNLSKTLQSPSLSAAC